MAIFIEKQSGFCDPNSELVRYYENAYKQIKEANRIYEYQNRVLRMRLATLENESFYGGNQALLEVTKQNLKLKKSLRKLYEKYIKPYQGSYADPDSKIFQRPITPEKTTSQPYITNSPTPPDAISVTQSQEFLKLQEEAANENKKVWEILTKLTRGDDSHATKDPFLEGLNYIDPKGNFKTIRLHKGNV